jgi:hypothetical protein
MIMNRYINYEYIFDMWFFNILYYLNHECDVILVPV